MSQFIVDKVQDYLQEVLPTLGLELFDVQFQREGHGWVLRVTIDSDAGISLNNCSDVSRELGQYLDVEDVIDHAYHLEVSSPGVERPLRSVADFQRFIGSKARVKFHEAFNGQKVFEGIIAEVENDTVRLQPASGEEIHFTYEMLNKARLSL